MYRVPGPITPRLLEQHGPTSDGWSPDRFAKPSPETAAACGWPLCGRQTAPAGSVDRRTHQSGRPGTRAA